MLKVIIDTRKMLPPFPFLVWNSSAINAILRKKGFNLEREYTRTLLEEGALEFTQGVNNAPKKQISTEGRRDGA